MPDSLPLEDQLSFSLYATTIAINRAYKPALDSLGITYPQYLVLSALWEEDGRTITAIADRLALDPSMITPLVKRLEAAGFVGRRRNPADERQVQVRLTDQGKAVSAHTKCLTDTLLERSGMTADQLTALNGEIQAFLEALAQSA